MIQLNDFTERLKAIVEGNVDCDCNFVLTASMFNAIKISGVYAAFVVLPRSGYLEHRKCSMKYKIELYIGIRNTDAGTGTDTTIMQKADTVLNLIRNVVSDIFADGYLKITEQENYTYYDNVEGITTKDYFWCGIPLTIEHFQRISDYTTDTTFN